MTRSVDNRSPLQLTTNRSSTDCEELVRRYADLVYTTARRIVGDSHLAEDVTQATFIVLARKVARVDPRTLPGWLVNTTRLVAIEALRSKTTRSKHEARAAEVRAAATASADEPTLTEFLPLLDEALSHLNEADRTAVCLRFLQGISFPEIGQSMGSSEEAARKRVSRAVEKLRTVFTKKGILPSTGGLMLLLATQQAKSAPATVLKLALGSFSSGGTPTAAALAKGVLTTMTWTTIKIFAALVFLILIAGGTGVGMHFIQRTSAQSAASQPADDAATLYLQGGKLVTDNYAVNIVSPADSNMAYAGYPPFSKEWQSMEKADFEATVEARALAHRARSTDHAVWPADRGANPGLYLDQLRTLTNDLGDAALYQHVQGNDAAAVETILDTRHLADLLDHHTDKKVVRLLVSIGIRALAMNRLDVISSGAVLTKDPRNGKDLQVNVAKELIGRLLDHPDARTEVDDFFNADAAQADVPQSESGKAVATAMRVYAECDMAAMSLACHLYRFENGKWPKSLDDLEGDLPRAPTDPYGDGKQTFGYVLIKGGLPDGSDRPLVYCRDRAKDGLFILNDQPHYGFYIGDGSNHQPQSEQKQGGQFRDVASWAPIGGRTPAVMTQPVEQNDK